MEFILLKKLAKMTVTQWVMVGVAAAAVVGLVILLIVQSKSKKPKKVDVRSLTYGAMCICISFILSYIKLFSAPQGGSVTLASMLPLLWYSNRYGWKKGVIAGLAYGLLQFIQKPEITHWAQVLIDYPLAFAALGLSGLVRPLPLGVVIGCAGRLLFHTVSGAIFFSETLNLNAWWVSFVYNGWYMLFETIICVALSFPLQAVVKRNKL
ncbi:MAG: energy-coupled thiamine transporter ThiT [Clostridia bacterium]|nr:energy-coupled thiamine transporter ThiT [Clostridia bacterium]